MASGSSSGSWRRILAVLAAGTLAAGLASCSDDDAGDSGRESDGSVTEVGTGDTYEATIVRTTDGVAHITAETVADAAFGQGWAQGEDRSCDLADQVLKIKGERARWFGPGDDDVHLESDIAWRTIGIAERAEEDFAETSDEVVELMTAFIDGWNAHLAEVGADGIAGWCSGEPWVQPLEPVDVYTYARGIALMASSVPVSGFIATAAPPSSEPAPDPTDDTDATEPGDDSDPADGSGVTDGSDEGAAASALDLSELEPAVASNGWALGSERTASGGGMLLANPHFPWEGELRFWESHVTVPDQVDMYGVQLSGLPGIGIGFNDQFGWTHTVSAGHRFTAYRLELVPGSPTTYVYGDEEREMTSTEHQIEVLRDDGSVEEVTHTSWHSHYGPIIDFPGFGWSEEATITYRDANIDNDEFMEQYLGMMKSQDLDEFMTVHEEVNGVPLFNTVATSADGRAWYADTSATPNLSDEALDLYEQMLADDPIVSIAAENGAILLDGSDPVFEWVEVDGARDPGLVPYVDQPQLLRDDYVFNANDSFWVANSEELLDGSYSVLHGRQESPLSPRTRQNLVVLDEVLLGDVTLDALTDAALANESFMATRLKDEIVERCRTAEGQISVPELEAEGDVEGLPAAEIDLTEACDVLADWDGVYDLDRSGPPIFREFLSRFDGSDLVEAGPLWSEGFDPARPAETPSGLAPAPAGGDDPILVNLARAVQTLDRAEIPLDASLGDTQFTMRGDLRVPIHGGAGREGVTNMVDPRSDHSILDPDLAEVERELLVAGSPLTRLDGEVGYPVTGGSSFVLALAYGDAGPEAKAFLVYGNTEDRSADTYAEVTEQFSRKAWRDVAFTADAIDEIVDHAKVVRG